MRRAGRRGNLLCRRKSIYEEIPIRSMNFSKSSESIDLYVQTLSEADRDLAGTWIQMPRGITGRANNSF